MAVQFGPAWKNLWALVTWPLFIPVVSQFVLAQFVLVEVVLFGKCCRTNFTGISFLSQVFVLPFLFQSAFLCTVAILVILGQLLHGCKFLMLKRTPIPIFALIFGVSHFVLLEHS